MQRYIVSQVEDDVSRGILREIAKDLDILLAQYMRALVILGLAASLTYGVFFSILGVPYAVLLAALAFPLEFIPMLGPSRPRRLFWLVAASSGYRHMWRLRGSGRLPHLPGLRALTATDERGMELHPLLVVFGVFAGEQIAGIPGAFSPCR